MSKITKELSNIHEMLSHFLVMAEYLAYQERQKIGKLDTILPLNHPITEVTWVSLLKMIGKNILSIRNINIDLMEL